MPTNRDSDAALTGRSTEMRAGLVTDDHSVFRMALASILQRHCGFEIVYEAESLDEAMQKLGDHPDISFATFDLAMPGVRGAGSLQSIREVFPRIVVAVVSASERRMDMVAAIEAGVHGYIPKTLPAAEIAEALNLVLSGFVYLPWSVSQLPPAPKKERDLAPPVAFSAKLTARQIDVLNLIRAGKSNKEIARALRLTENTVKVHTNALYRALGVRNRVSAASARIE